MHKEHDVVYSSDFVLRVVLVLFCLFAVLVYIFVFSIVCESNEIECLQLSLKVWEIGVYIMDIMKIWFENKSRTERYNAKKRVVKWTIIRAHDPRESFPGFFTE